MKRYCLECDTLIKCEKTGKWVHLQTNQADAYDLDADHDAMPEELEESETRGSYSEEGDDIEFADPGGKSALRAASSSNPRNLPCPNCKQPNRLTPADRAHHYVCDFCADRAENGLDY